MTNPWKHSPPIQQYGDIDPAETFKGVGRVMSAWESVEFQLCIIHAAFCGDPRGEAMRLYGSKRTLPGRLEDFSKVAERYFMMHPDQSKEGALDKLIGEVRMFVDRRNEVAHGIVIKISNIAFFRRYLRNKSDVPPQFAVLPPYHGMQWHASDGLPRYAYTSHLLSKLETQLIGLLARLQEFERSLSTVQPQERHEP